MPYHLNACPLHAIGWVIRGVILESLRRRETSVVMLFMGLFAIGVIVARVVGAESEAAATFMINLGLSVAWILAMVLTILISARQFPDELEQRLLYPLLAKPLSRNQYILGKWIATWMMGAGTALLLNILALVTAPWPKHLSGILLIQGLTLEVLALGVAAGIAIWFSFNMPKALAIVSTMLLVFLGGVLLNFLRSHAGQGSGGNLLRWVLDYVPDFGRWDVINGLSGGDAALPFIDFLIRIAIAVITMLLALVLAARSFSRRSL